LTQTVHQPLSMSMRPYYFILSLAALAANAAAISDELTSPHELVAAAQDSAEQDDAEEAAVCFLQTHLHLGVNLTSRKLLEGDAGPIGTATKVTTRGARTGAKTANSVVPGATGAATRTTKRAAGTAVGVGSKVAGTVGRVGGKYAGTAKVVGGAVVGGVSKGVGAIVGGFSKGIYGGIGAIVTVGKGAARATVSGIKTAVRVLPSSVTRTVARGVARGAKIGKVGVRALDRFTTPKFLGSSIETINKVLMGLIAIIVTVVWLAILFDYCCPSLAPSKGRPSMLLVGLLVSSYILLIPGIFANLFSFQVLFKILGFNIAMSNDPFTEEPVTTIMKSTWTLIRMLWESECRSGAFLVVLYAILIPIMKAAFLAIGELYRYSDVAANRRISLKCIKAVQMVSKWACPDMFAYILLMYLLRTISDGTSLVTSIGQLDVGFSCFSIFCCLSTVSSLAVQLPETLDSLETEDSTSSKFFQFLCGCLGRPGVLLVLIVVFAGFCHEMYYGMFAPVMGLHLKAEMLIDPLGPIPAVMAPAVYSIGIEDKIKSQVSLWSCTSTLIGWSWSKSDGNCILALIMVAGFTIFCTWLNMIVLLIAGFGCCCSTASQARMLYATQVLHKLSMLDVCLMGIIVVCLVGKMYEEVGVVFYIFPGLWTLLRAELLHYLAYYVVSAAAELPKNSSQGLPIKEIAAENNTS